VIKEIEEELEEQNSTRLKSLLPIEAVSFEEIDEQLRLAASASFSKGRQGDASEVEVNRTEAGE
jgi:hypothetical protein